MEDDFKFKELYAVACVILAFLVLATAETLVEGIVSLF